MSKKSDLTDEEQAALQERLKGYELPNQREPDWESLRARLDRPNPNTARRARITTAGPALPDQDQRHG